MKNCKISIITPAFNCEKYLTETFNSVINQSFTDWEWLIIEDCSTDNTRMLLHSLSENDKRIKVILNKKNIGASASRNKGLVMRKGEYIAFLDSDDLWHKDKLKLQLNFMIKKQCDLSFTNTLRFLRSPASPHSFNMVPLKVTYNDILVNNTITTSSVMVKTASTEGITFKDAYYDDFLFWLDILSRTSFGYGIREELTFYRLTPNSLSRNKLKSAFRVYNTFQEFNLSERSAYSLFVEWILRTSLRYLKMNLRFFHAEKYN